MSTDTAGAANPPAPSNSAPRTPSSRGAAIEAIRAALSGERFAARTLRALSESDALASRDLALATEIALGAVRHVHIIDRILAAVGRYERRRVTVELRAALYAGVYQILWMDRVPVAAAVDETVRAARALAGRRAAGLVNALLRAVARALVARRTAWERLNPTHVRVDWDAAVALSVPFAPAAVIPGEAPGNARLCQHLAAITGETEARFRTLAQRFGVDRAERIAWAAQARPAMRLHRNTLRVSAEQFRAALAEFGVDAGSCQDDWAALPAGASIAEFPLLKTGGAFVQDSTAHEAALAVEARPGQRVLDLCAAPGGKALALALAMRDRGEILACDVSDARLALVNQNAARLGLSCIRTIAWDATQPVSPEIGLFDAVLVDAPCSNSGVIARRPEARFDKKGRDLGELAQLQARLLDAAAARVAPAGRLVYSTCSIEPEENEQALATFAQRHAGWRVVSARLTLPEWGASPAEWRDGGFVAILDRDSGNPA